jgi:hypothetical protein
MDDRRDKGRGESGESRRDGVWCIYIAISYRRKAGWIAERRAPSEGAGEVWIFEFERRPLLAITVSGLCRDWKTAQALRVMTEKTVRGFKREEGGCVRQIGGCKFSGGEGER